MQRFTLPRDLYHGEGALAVLKELKGSKAMVLVGGGSMKRGGFLQQACDYLVEAGFAISVYEGIEADPSIETVMQGAQAMLDFKPDWIVAMGGGSVIDAAKAMWIKYEVPDITFEEMQKPLPKLRRKAHFAAIPSTSGTATEVTAFSIITDYSKGIKYPIADYEITPDIAIVDAALVAALPQKQVAHTGMDALTHAIEAYVSTANSAYSDGLALHAIELVHNHLIASYNGDQRARTAMHDAQCLAGMAFSNALLGIVHSMAHKTGAAFADYGAHIIHGAANAMYLPKVGGLQCGRPGGEDTLRAHCGYDGAGRQRRWRKGGEPDCRTAGHERRAEHSSRDRHLWRRCLSGGTGLRAGSRIFGTPAGNREECHRGCLHALEPAPAFSGRDGSAAQKLLLRHRG